MKPTAEAKLFGLQGGVVYGEACNRKSLIVALSV